MKEYLELGKNGQLTLPPSICRAAKIQEGDLLKAVIDEDDSIHLIALTTKERKLVKQSRLKDIYSYYFLAQGSRVVVVLACLDFGSIISLRFYIDRRSKAMEMALLMKESILTNPSNCTVRLTAGYIAGRTAFYRKKPAQNSLLESQWTSVMLPQRRNGTAL